MKYIFFDLDETLTDHKYACQKSIEAIIEVHDCLRVKTVEQLENEFWQMLNGNYNHVLDGSLSMKDTRIQRITALFTGCAVDPPEQLAADLFIVSPTIRTIETTNILTSHLQPQRNL